MTRRHQIALVRRWTGAIQRIRSGPKMRGEWKHHRLMAASGSNSNLSVDQTVLPHHVKRALAYMSANLAEKIALADVVSACATTERTLLKGFRKCIGLPPLAYLRRLRLNVARRELLQAGSGEVISDIAIRCGYPHLGRFAGDYRRVFGKSPSATKQRVRLSATRALANDGAACSGSPVTAMWCERPSLLILPLRTETLQERLEARDLTEQLAATLSRMRIASVALAHPLHRPISLNAPQSRNAGSQDLPAGSTEPAGGTGARDCQADRHCHRSAPLGRQLRWFRQ